MTTAWIVDLVATYPVLVVVPVIAAVAAFFTYRVAQSVVEWCSRVVRSAVYGCVALLVFVVVAGGLTLGVYVAAPHALVVAPPSTSPTGLVVGALVDRYLWSAAPPPPVGKRWVLVDDDVDVDVDDEEDEEAPPWPAPPAPTPPPAPPRPALPPPADTVAGRKKRRQQGV